MKIQTEDGDKRRLDEWLKSFGDGVYKRNHDKIEQSLEEMKVGRNLTVYILLGDGPQSFTISKV